MSLMLRHMFYRVLAYTASVSVVLGFVVLLSKAQPLFNLLAQGAMPPSWLLLALSLLVPEHIYEAIPFAITVAVVHTYSKWGRDNEIVSLRMAGLPDRALALPGLAAAAAALIFTASMSLYVVPVSFRAYEDIKYAAQINVTLSLLDEGYLQHVAPDLSMSFRRRHGSDEIEGVTILDSRKHGSVTYILAQQAQLVRDESSRGRALILNKGSYQVRHEAGDSPAPVDFAELTLPIFPDGASRARESRGLYEQHIGQLLNPPSDIRVNAHQHGEYVAEGHKRIIMPLLCLSYAAFSLGMMLTASSRRGSRATLPIAVTLAGVGAWQGLLVAVHALVAQVPALASAYYVAGAIPGIVGALLLTPMAPGVLRTLRHFSARLAAIGLAKAQSGVR